LSTNLAAERWWQRSVVYQVYARSFQDSNGDGVGDLRGIRQRLDHLEWLDIDAVWLSPIYPSPMADFSYDVADYTDVDPLFGTLEDLDGLIEDLHRRGMRLLLDFVPNHTSSLHPWFVDALTSRAAEHRNWYIWRDAAPDGGPPNDWASAFGGSAWEWHEVTGQFYFHSFLREQPDLDWTNPRVRVQMTDVLRFWLRRGVDGFRIDVVNLLAKGRELQPTGGVLGPDGPWGDQHAIHPIMRDLRAVADEFDDRVLIGEIWLPLEQLVTFYGAELEELHLPFNFRLLDVPWEADRVHEAIRTYEGALPRGAWPNWVLGNHDRPRIVTRVGAAQARVAQMLLITLRGTPTLYYGDEIGMTEVELPRSAWRDPQGLRGGPTRDGCRTPMRWDATARASFTTGEPWLPLGQPAGVDVASQRDDPDSMLSLCRSLLRLRRAERALSIGEWHDLGHADTSLAYLRGHGARRFLVCLNLAGVPSALPAQAHRLPGRVVASTLGSGGQGDFHPGRGLAGDEGLVILLD